MKKSLSTIVLIMAAIVVLGGGYWYFFTGNETEAPLTSGEAASPAEVRFQTLVSQLQPITFDTGIFSDARFNSLVDLATPVAPEPVGRLDPFAPIAGVVSQ